MKFSTVIVALAAAAASVSAHASETNGDRLARGLPPLPPVRRASRVEAARRSSPSGSGINNSCNTGPVQCCNTVTSFNPTTAKIVSSLLSVVVPANVAVGLTCSPLSVIGIGGKTCRSQPVCCSNNSFKGLIAIGCSPININA